MPPTIPHSADAFLSSDEISAANTRATVATVAALAASNDRLAAQLAEAHASAAAVRSALAEANAAHAGEVRAHRAAFHALTVAHAAAITSLGDAFHAWVTSPGSPVTATEDLMRHPLRCDECGGIAAHTEGCASGAYGSRGHVMGCTGNCLPGCGE